MDAAATACAMPPPARPAARVQLGTETRTPQPVSPATVPWAHRIAAVKSTPRALQCRLSTRILPMAEESCTGLPVAAADELCGTVSSRVSTHGYRRTGARPVDCYLCRTGMTACTLPAELQLQSCQLLDGRHGTRARSNAPGALRRRAKTRWPPRGRFAQEHAPAKVLVRPVNAPAQGLTGCIPARHTRAACIRGCRWALVCMHAALPWPYNARRMLVGHKPCCLGLWAYGG